MNGKFDKILVPVIAGLAILALMFFFVKEIVRVVKIPKVEKIKEEVKEEIPPAQYGLASGKQIYEIITDKPRDPQIIEVEVDPLDVESGENQIVTVKIKTKATAVTEADLVSGKAITDNKTTDFSLKLKKAEGEEELITTWQGEWMREDSIEKNYQIKIFAKNEKGQDQTTLTFR